MSPNAQPDPFETPEEGRLSVPSRLPPRWVHVPGVVGHGRGVRFSLWEITYPLPDGSAATLHVVPTTPSALRVGMTVPVLVDANNPHHARLDFPAHTQRRNLILFAVAAFLGLAMVIPGFFLLLFALL